MEKSVCVVSDVGPGTGRAIADRFSTEGYEVAILARREDRLRSFAENNSQSTR